jgi:hypothetical protein
VVIFTFQPLCPLEKDPLLSIEWENVWALRDELGILEKINILPLPGFEPLIF